MFAVVRIDLQLVPIHVVKSVDKVDVVFQFLLALDTKVDVAIDEPSIIVTVVAAWIEPVRLAELG